MIRDKGCSFGKSEGFPTKCMNTRARDSNVLNYVCVWECWVTCGGQERVLLDPLGCCKLPSVGAGVILSSLGLLLL